MSFTDLYQKYDLLLPPKFDGGYLILSLFEKIESREIEEYFTIREVTETLREISVQFGQDSVRQWSSIKDSMFQYFLRSHPDEPWKYYLTEYARNVIDLMMNKIENPYKNYPLKKSVQETFTLRYAEIKTLEELERKFGRIFIQGAKKIVTDHLESLEDELRNAYVELNGILRKDEQSATLLVKDFAIIFKKFGLRAEDITEAILTKDKFLNDLLLLVDRFYQEIEDASNSGEGILHEAILSWEKARSIYTDIKDFFNSVDSKIALIRKQIIHASSKLTELQEHFSARAQFKIRIKNLYRLALESAEYNETEILFKNNFPLKSLPYEKTKMLFPKYHDFETSTPNFVKDIVQDHAYEEEERTKIEKEINRQQLINSWVDVAKHRLEVSRKLTLNEFLEEIAREESDLSLAYQVVSQVMAYASEQNDILVDVKQNLIFFSEHNMALWKTTIMK